MTWPQVTQAKTYSFSSSLRFAGCDGSRKMAET